MISFRECRIRLSDHYSLGNLDFCIEPGQAWIVAGANGSGKSALVAALAGEGQVVSGERNLGDERVSVVSLEEQARLIARERERDDSDLTDEINEGTPVHEMLSEVSRDDSLKQELISSLGLSALLERGFRKLSTGETRKVLLIRALTSLPDVLIMDEPFEGLDVATVPRIAALMSELNDRGVTQVLALNRLEETPDYATHALRLEGGRVTQHFQDSNIRQLLTQISSIRADDVSLPPPELPVEAPRNEDGSLVQLKNGKVAYTDNVVFEKLDWTVNPGEHWQVKGPNGSGKTCLLNLVTGDHPQCYVNDIRVFGMQRGSGETIWDIKQYLGFVSTGLHWDYRLSVSVRSVILSGFYDSIGLYHSATEKQQQVADDWLTLLGMASRGGESFSALSYGEQRVLLIARAMVKHPPLLLLDEPCLGLDEANRQLVLALIERICEEGNTTLIYVTHHDEDAIRHIRNELDLA